MSTAVTKRERRRHDDVLRSLAPVDTQLARLPAVVIRGAGVRSQQVRCTLYVPCSPLQVSVKRGSVRCSAGSLSISCAGADANRCASADPGRGTMEHKAMMKSMKKLLLLRIGSSRGTGWLLVPLQCDACRGESSKPPTDVTG